MFWVVLLGCQEIKGQTVIYSQGFETANDWSLSPSNYTNNRNYWVWESGTALATTGSATHSGTKSLQIWKYTDLGWESDYGNNSTNLNYRTASKTFDFSTVPCGSSITFKYWVLCNGETGHDDLTVSVDNNIVQGPMSEITSWQQKTINLSAYVGNSNVTISFNWRNNNSTRNQPAARIDDIEISYNTFITANAGPDVTVCSGSSSQLIGTSTAITLGSTTSQANLMANYVTDISNTEISVSITGAPVNATITSLTFTPKVWVGFGNNYLSCYQYGSWVKMQYWNGATWIDIANCNQPITISDFNGNLANGTLIKIRCVNIAGDFPDYVYTDLLNVDANYQFSSGITYSWSPTTGLNSSTINNPISTPSVTTTYTMTATSGSCSVTDNVIVTVNPKTTPTFTQVAAVCSGATIAALPTTSNNGVTGTWSPAINNTATTTYTFTPTDMVCNNNATINVTVNPNPSTTLIYHQ